MKGVALALVLAAAASQHADAFLFAKLPASKAQQAWIQRSSQQRPGRCVCVWVWLDMGAGLDQSGVQPR
jgi:hypothetical protein